jgi:hypothetical protein
MPDPIHQPILYHIWFALPIMAFFVLMLPTRRIVVTLALALASVGLMLWATFKLLRRLTFGRK